MTDSIFANPSPVTPNDFDGGSHAWGMKFTVSADATCVGGRAWIPAAGRPATFLWQIWRVGDATKIAETDLRAAGHGTPSNGAWYSFDSSLFTTPGDVALSSAQTYRVCVAFNNGDGVYTDDGSETFPTGTGVVSSTTGSFTNGGGTNVMPGTDYLAWFFADVTVETGGDDATATPAAISVTTSVGAPSISTGSTTSPSAIAATTSVPSPTPSTGSTATPAAISAVASVPGPSISTGSTVSPAAIAAATTVPAPTPSASATATPTAIAATASLGAPALSVGITLVPAAIAAVVTFPATNVFTGTIVRTVWRAGPPESKWAAGPPQSKWSVGRMPVEVFRATSTETIRSGAITADSAGAAVDPTGFTVTMAYTSTNTAPAAASSAWKAATWDTNSTTTPAIYRAQAAIGPSGVQELSPGTHYLFVKIAASGETPIIPSGAFKVVP